MKHIITLSIFLAFSLSAEEVSSPIESPPLDPGFKELLESTKMPYTFTGDTPYFQLPQEDGKVENVYVMPSVDQFGNYTVRKIVGYVYQVKKEKPSPVILENALLFSNELRTSRFQLLRHDDSNWSLCVVGLFPNSGDEPTFKQMVEAIGYTSWKFKKDYINMSDTPKAAVTDLPNKNDKESAKVSDNADFRKDVSFILRGNTQLRLVEEKDPEPEEEDSGFSLYDEKTKIRVSYRVLDDGRAMIIMYFEALSAVPELLEMANKLEMKGVFQADSNLTKRMSYLLIVPLETQNNKEERVEFIKTHILQAADLGDVLTKKGLEANGKGTKGK